MKKYHNTDLNNQYLIHQSSEGNRTLYCPICKLKLNAGYNTGFPKVNFSCSECNFSLYYYNDVRYFDISINHNNIISWRRYYNEDVKHNNILNFEFNLNNLDQFILTLEMMQFYS